LPTKESAPQGLTTQERFDLAEAETIEALRDILKAEARSAAAEASMTENLVEVSKAVGNGVMSIFGQGPLPTNSPPAWLGPLLKELGKDAAMELVNKGLDWVKEQLLGGAEKQKGRAEQTGQSAAKEAVAKGGKPTVPTAPGPVKTPTFSGLGVNPPPGATPAPGQ
jgi:hypothetical protein